MHTPDRELMINKKSRDTIDEVQFGEQTHFTGITYRSKG